MLSATVFRLGISLISALSFLYLFHWKLLTLISAIFCYYVWKDRRGNSLSPTLYYQPSSTLCNKLILACSTLTEKYTTPLLWGKYGHVHTLLYGICGRFGITPLQSADRHTVIAADGTTVYYDVFHPDNDNRGQYSYMFLVCPGIGSHSGGKYIQSFIQHAAAHGYCTAVMNHVGALQYSLSGNRIFSYGGTGDLALTYEQLKKQFPDCKFIGVGFSMGANILLKFLGECPERQADFVCAVSICQGYDAVKAVLTNKDGWNSFYNIGVTKGVMRIIKQHHHRLLPGDTIPVKQPSFGFLANFIDLLSIVTCLFSDNYGIVADSSTGDRDYDELVASHDSNGFPLDQGSCEPVDMRGLSQAQIMQQLDECYTRRVMGFRSIRELYKWSSCAVLMHKIKTLPMLLVNAKDDPLVWEELLTIPADYTKFNNNAIFLLSESGGHLGFFEGGLLVPHSTSWIDRVIVDYTTAILKYSNK